MVSATGSASRSVRAPSPGWDVWRPVPLSLQRKPMRHIPAPVLSLLCLVAAAGQADGTQARSASGSAGLNAVPNCASGLSATLSDGLRVGYRGSDPNDPDR